MKLETILTTGEKLIAAHQQIQGAISTTTSELHDLDARLAEAEQQVRADEASTALGEGGMLDASRKTLASISARRDGVASRLAGLRDRLTDIQHEGKLKAVFSEIQNSAELREIASQASVQAQAEIDRSALQLHAALSRARALEQAGGREFIELPALPSAAVDPVALAHSSAESKPRILAQANRAALLAVPADMNSLPETISRASSLRNGLIAAIGQVEGARRTEQRARHRARTAAAGHGLQVPSGLAIPRTPDNKAPQPWYPAGGMTS